jgi:hypothetical protein
MAASCSEVRVGDSTRAVLEGGGVCVSEGGGLNGLHRCELIVSYCALHRYRLNGVVLVYVSVEGPSGRPAGNSNCIW